MRLLTRRREEIINKMRHNPKDWRFEQIRGLLEHYGFEMRKPTSGGSHYVFVHPELDFPLTIPWNRPIKPIYVKRALQFLDDLFERRRERDEIQ